MSTDLQRRTILALAAGLPIPWMDRSVFAAETTPPSSENAAHPETFGARGDGHSDDTDAIQKALDASQVVALRTGRSYSVRTLVVPSGRVLEGNGAWLLQSRREAGDGSPLISIAEGPVQICNVAFNGNRATQPADGYSDSFDGGRGKTGRAYRAAIRIDASGKDVERIRISRCQFREFYGACIAARQCSRLVVEHCTAFDSNFELLMTAASRSTSDIVLRGNTVRNIGSGDMHVNANGAVVAFASRIIVEGNRFSSVERNALKLEETCTDVVVSNNELEGNKTDNFAFVQVQSLHGHRAERIAILHNRAATVGAGFAFNTAHLSDAVIMGNTVDRTFGSILGDGIQIANGVVDRVVVAFNRLNNIRRHGIVIGAAAREVPLDGISVFQNDISLMPEGAGIGMLLNAQGRESLGSVALIGNKIDVPPAPGYEARRLRITSGSHETLHAITAVANVDKTGSRIDPLVQVVSKQK